jgi:predicted HNH restriction endonuclease
MRAQGCGEDALENTVGLCPNCHRMMHSLKRKSDIDMLILANKASRKNETPNS